MPEGPTIRNTADLLRETLLDQRITQFHSSLKKAAAESWAEKLVGQSVMAVRVHGKNLFIDIAGGFSQVFLPPALREATHALGYVYGRSSQICLRCGGTIAMIRQGPMQRMTFFCPFCQPLDPASPPVRQEQAAQTTYTDTIHTLEDAREFVFQVGLCGIAHDPKGKLPTLWDALAFPGSGPDRWGEKLARVWALRQQLVANYPEQLFTGKIRGGRVVLMSMERLGQEYARAHRPLERCSELAQQLYVLVERGPITTAQLRQEAGMVTRKDRSRFERAFQELQASLNIARSPASDSVDVWVPFFRQYPQIAETFEVNSPV